MNCTTSISKVYVHNKFSALNIYTVVMSEYVDGYILYADTMALFHP